MTNESRIVELEGKLESARRQLVGYFLDYPACEEDEKFNAEISRAPLEKLIAELIKGFQAKYVATDKRTRELEQLVIQRTESLAEQAAIRTGQIEWLETRNRLFWQALSEIRSVVPSSTTLEDCAVRVVALDDYQELQHIAGAALDADPPVE